jgi:hypothetical protein
MEVVNMPMEEIEFLGPAGDFLQQENVMSEPVHRMGVEPQRAGGAGHQPSRGVGISAREQSDVVTLPDQLIGEPGDHPLGATIEVRGDALV